MTMRNAMLVTLAAVLGGCGGAAAPTQVDEARALWAETKADCRTYHYTIGFESFTGNRQQTSFEFVDDVPTVRTYVWARREVVGMTSNFVIVESWVETGAEVGTHVAGQAPRTMEQLYDECERDVLSQNPATNAITFSSDQRGVLQSCFFVPVNCADDCAMGDVVTSFGCGSLDRTPPRP